MLTPDVIASLKAKYPKGEIHKMESRGHVAVFRLPNTEEYQMYRDYGHDSEKRSMATVKLVDQCVIWPDRPEWRDMVDRYPGLYETFGNKLTELAGASQVVETEKL